MGPVDGDEGSVFVHFDSGTAIIHVKGETDLLNAERIRTALDPFEASDVEAIIVDAGDLQFMDSSGFAVLMKLALQFGGSITIRNATPMIRRIVEVGGLSSVLRLEGGRS